ncbi:MAG TPA: hypothetical protein VKR06_05220 [Ktedonosporobacter sp.]|nr:hypothetical protein [Ktedonosporobacter sp.]
MQENTLAEAAETEAQCCATSDGSPVCLVPQSGQQCGCAEPKSSPLLVAPRRLPHDSESPGQHDLWMMVRSSLLFVVGCLTSPCCAPVLVPIGLALLAATPVAVFLTQYLGWVYGVLTVVSVGSFLLTFLSLRRRSTRSLRISRLK